ncbi:hypothetical protein VTN49DRAFT_2984 [Thermomyces lanuginosus]|uniref:uncharacterized protein n=1 Tax=Thermomyces lanuginosus TaxID=5541 RepID=UPI003743CB67
MLGVLWRRSSLAEASIVDALLECRPATGQYDPLISLYMDLLIKLGLVKIPTVLKELFQYCSIAPKDERLVDLNAKATTLMADTRIVQDVMILLSSGNCSLSLSETVAIFSVLADWILAIVRWHNSNLSEDQQTGGIQSSSDASSLFESIGILFVAVSGLEKGLEALSLDKPEGFKIKLGQALNAYLSSYNGISVNLRNRLDNLQKAFDLYGEPPSKSLDMPMMDAVNINVLQFEESVMDRPVMNARAGLYIYINAILVGRPLVDDTMFMNYLSNRYAGDAQMLVEELITATFDVLSNAMYRNECRRNMFIFRSFLVNKLPPFLAGMAATSMEPIPMEVCISNALSRVDPNAFPSFSQMFEMTGNTVLSDVRQEFLFSCALHRLIPESSIERLLGENPMQTLPVGGRYIKDNIINQITSSQDRADQLISEIESMEGNAGIIVAAITDVMHSLCNQKETVTLKALCNSLSRRPQVLDVMLLFRSPRAILQPLCVLLDTWRWDEDQGENQPVYDEFGSVLLLILAFKYRYDLTQYDLGISDSQSFVWTLLDRGSCSMKLEDLSEKQHKNLGQWISALFIAEGISEETMSSCSPQEYYLLVPTLFSQTVGACEMGKLEFDTLKGGLEYLLEPFLLPSLVFALTWLGNYIWESEAEPTIALKALHALVKPNSISGEADAIHKTVLGIVARGLEEQLHDLFKRHRSRTDIKPILDVLEPHVSFKCNGSSSRRTDSDRRSELDTWTTHAGGLMGVIQMTFHSLVIWSANPESNMSAPSYTHRLILTGVRLLSATRVLPVLIDELHAQVQAGNLDIALDVAATLICAPMPESFAVDQAMFHPLVESSKEAQPQSAVLTLRDALLLQYENVPKIAEKDPLRAEIIVRLNRRVNALLAIPEDVTNLDMTNIIENINMDASGNFAPGVSAEQNEMNVGGVTGGPADDFDQMLKDAAAAGGNQAQNPGMEASRGLDGGMAGMQGTAMDTSIDDMFNAANMDNPELLTDLDMDGMFG